MKEHSKKWFEYNEKLSKVIEDFFHKNNKYHIKEEGNWYTYSWRGTRSILRKLRFAILKEIK